MNKLSPVLISAALLLAGAGCAPATQSPENPAAPTAEAPPITPETMPEIKTKSFVVTANNFKYDMDQIEVEEGDVVQITFKNTEGFHDFVIDEFGVASQKLTAPAEETLTFKADKKGTFEYYCSVGKHREMGMKGTLTVK